MDDELIQVGSPLPRIASATALDERKVSVAWRDGKTQVIDIMPALASHRSFIRLRTDDELFRKLKVDDYGDHLEWDDGAQLAAVWLAELAPATLNNEEFRQAMDTLQMSLDGMAARLGIARRLVADYRKDKPIPPSIALATRYLLEHMRKAG